MEFLLGLGDSHPAISKQSDHLQLHHALWGIEWDLNDPAVLLQVLNYPHQIVAGGHLLDLCTHGLEDCEV